MKLDLGAGKVSPPGFLPMGREHGTEIFPLPYPDDAIDEIRASHVLEHFPTAQIDAVIQEWVRALRPGGVLRIAVPDFAKIAEGYLAGEMQPTEGYIMGGQDDESDLHRAIFDEQRLKKALSAAGLVLLRPWRSDIVDCAALPISCNIEGTKPYQKQYTCAAVMSVPRLGFGDMMFTAQEALPRLGISLTRSTGAFWGQGLTTVMETALKGDPNFILTLDYDSLFDARDVATLLQLMLCHPEVDAIAPLQSSRGLETALFSRRDENGKTAKIIPVSDLENDLLPVATAHFGLTVLRASTLRKATKPWFHSRPDPAGGWGEGRTDEDISFWRNWVAAGFSICIAPRVVIGHMELMVRWPGRDLLAIHQSTSEWREKGRPEGAWK